MPLAIVQGSSDLWVNAGSQAEAALNLGYLNDQTINSTGGFTSNAGPSTATAFVSTGDQTSYYVPARRLRIVHGGASTDTTYCEVASASFAGGQTTVTVRGITSGATALSTAAIATVGFSPVYNTTGGAGNWYRYPRLATTKTWGL